jgi:hypothetical protein
LLQEGRKKWGCAGAARAYEQAIPTASLEKLAWSKIRKTGAPYSVSVSWVIGWRLNSFLVQT